MVETFWALRDTLAALCALTSVRVLIKTANAGLNVLRDLLDAVSDASPIAMLIAVAWLIPWYRLALPLARRAGLLRSSTA